MDPRPYHYEYRRPRLTNPTYQSVNLYQSLYHRGILNRYQNNNDIGTFKPRNQFQKQIYEHSILVNKSKQLQNQKIKQTEIHSVNYPLSTRKMSGPVIVNTNNNIQISRPNSNKSNYSNDSNNLQDYKPSILSSYGKNTIPHKMITQNVPVINSEQKVFDKLNQFSVYKKQQKPFSIIGNYPRSHSTSLREYPKLTLQNKLIQEGRYLPNN